MLNMKCLCVYFRKNYKSYINVYKKVLVNPNDTELKIDLQMLEDELNIFNLVLAREHAKIEVCNFILVD